MVFNYPYWWVKITSVIFIATQLYALLIIAHDGLHRRLFFSVGANDLWNDVSILGAIGMITRLNRINHLRHHQELAMPSDPDRFKYSSSGRSTRFEFLLSLTCIPLLAKAFVNIAFPKLGLNWQKKVTNLDKNKHMHADNYSIRDLLIIAIWQISLIGGLSFVIGWWAYPVLWVAPLLIAVCCDMLRVFCEHSMVDGDDEADFSMRLVSYEANSLEKIIFSPHNMNHHIAHHLWPSIPYYNLDKAEKLIRPRVEANSPLVWRSSYFGWICRYMGSLK